MSSNHNKSTISAPADDIDSLIERTGCRDFYQNVEDCLARNDRAMSKCQTELITFKTCYDQAQQKRREQTSKK
jgi:uncharacterized protein YgiB involved in biofilm formation